MSAELPGDITALLFEWSNGNKEALNKLVPVVYNELHKLAHRCMAKERDGHTLQTTALIHELYFRLVDWQNVDWRSRAHFFGVAAQLMRRILVDYSRCHYAAKRGSGLQKLPLDEAPEVTDERLSEFIELDEALASLEKIDSRQSKIVELRYFGGLTIEEIAELNDISPTTVKRELTVAKAWLGRELQKNVVLHEED